MNDAGHQHAYPSRVRFELADNDVAAYTRAAYFLNVNAVAVISDLRGASCGRAHNACIAGDASARF